MKTKKMKFVAIILPLIAILLLSASLPQSLAPQENPDRFGDFEKKSYYKNLFSASQIAELKALSALNSKGKKYKTKAGTYKKSLDTYNKIAEVAKSSRDRKKAIRKAARVEKKMAKQGAKAYKYFAKANQAKFQIYESGLSKVKKDRSTESAKGSKLITQAKREFNSALSLIKKAKDSEGSEKYELLQKAHTIQIKAIRKQEMAFGFFMKDPLLIDKKEDVVDNNNGAKKDTTKNNGKTENNKQNGSTDNGKTNNTTIDKIVPTNYKPENDKNLYKSVEKIIFEKIKLSPQEQQMMINARAKVTEGDKLYAKVDEEYKQIKVLLKQAEKEKVFKKQELIKQKAQEKEMFIFAWMLKAAGLYGTANSIKTDIYLVHIENARKGSPKKAKAGLVHEKRASSHLIFAESLFTRSKIQQYKSQKYLSKMEGIMLQHDAIQELEYAYSLYYGFKISEDVPQNSGQNGNTVAKKDNNNNSSKKTANKYILKSTIKYTAKDKKGVSYKSKKGITFRVQMSVGLNNINATKFMPVTPIIYDTFKDNKFKRFYAGEYYSNEAIEKALQILKAKGARSDIKIVAFQDGKRTSYSKAVKKLNKNSAYKKTMKAELAALSGKKDVKKDVVVDNGKKADPNKGYGKKENDFAAGTKISSTKGLAYAVQIGMFSLPKTNSDLAGVSPLYVNKTKSGYKYFAGTFSTKVEADQVRNKLVKSGYTGAFVVAFNDGKKITLGEAKKREQVKGGNTTTKKVVKKDNSEVRFKIQIGAYSSLSKETKALHARITSQRFIIDSSKDTNGLTIYTIGNVKTYEEAKQIKKQLKDEGFPEGFVIAYIGSKKVKAGEAINFLKKRQQ